MRLISQDGLLDVSYENVLLNIYDGDRAVVIKAYDSISNNDFVCMGVYETLKKAESVMKMVREEYKKFATATNSDSFYEFFDKPKVFQFPADDEVEV